MAKQTLLIDSKWIRLIRNVSKQSGRAHFTIVVSRWDWPKTVTYDSVQEHFNPSKVRGNSLSWKFKSRKEAEQLITTALLKWGA